MTTKNPSTIAKLEAFRFACYYLWACRKTSITHHLGLNGSLIFETDTHNKLNRCCQTVCIMLLFY